MIKNKIAILLAATLVILGSVGTSVQASESTRITVKPNMMITKLDGTVISLNGSAGGGFDLELKHKKITVKNVRGRIFSNDRSKFGKTYIRLTLTDENGKLKGESNIYGDMYSVNKEVSNLNNICYEYGYILTVTNFNKNGVKINKTKTQSTESTQKVTTKRYKLTMDGLEEI